MAKKSMWAREAKRTKTVAKYANKRAELKAIINDRSKPMEERFAAQLKLANMPRNSSKTRVRNRCEITGRPRAFYRKMKICRNQLRELASQGMIPGMVKSSW